MGTSRTSNKDIADRLDTLIDLLVKQAMPVAPTIPTLAVEQAEAAPSKEGGLEVDSGYKSRMEQKATAHAVKHGTDVVLYARRNKAGEVKLAYALKERWDAGIKDGGMIGAIGVFSSAEEELELVSD